MWVYYHLFCLVIGCLLTSCVPVEKPPPSPPLSLDFDKKQIQEYWDFVDKRDRLVLLRMMRDDEAAARLVSLKNYAVERDSTVLDTIAGLIKDPERLIKESAAFALGQSRHPYAAVLLTRAFQELDSSEYQNFLSTLILEGIGKSGDRSLEQYLAKVRTYRAEDRALSLGRMLALYRFALRGMSSQEGMKISYQIVQDSLYDDATRLMAAHYLGRSKQLNIRSIEEGLREIGLSEKNPFIRMAIATAFRHSKTNFGYLTLLDWYEEERDYRVKANILKSLISFNQKDLYSFLLKVSLEQDVHLATIASDALVDYTKAVDAKKLRQLARSPKKMAWQVRANLYRAANTNLPNSFRIAKTNMNQEIMRRYKNNKDPYIKAAYMRAWSAYGVQLDDLIKKYKTTKEPVIRTSILESLIDNASKDKVHKVYWGYQGAARRKTAKLMEQAVLEADPSAVALVCNAISREFSYWKPYFEHFDFVAKGVESLKLPRDFEAYQAAKTLLAKSAGEELSVKSIKPKYNHPIDWSLVSELPDTLLARIETSRGIIDIEMYRNIAPGAVANFVQLAEVGFFNQKRFHRVVPNFVIQTGCPIGNGYGSLDYTIRSEFSTLRYDDEGWVGMASVGPDTESTQWFITHSPTPHLDGRYSIFGKVREGMETVHKIVQGDRIIKVTIQR